MSLNYRHNEPDLFGMRNYNLHTPKAWSFQQKREFLINVICIKRLFPTSFNNVLHVKHAAPTALNFYLFLLPKADAFSKNISCLQY